MPQVLEEPVQRTVHSRVWLIEDGAGPANTPEYQGQARAQSLSWPQGEVTAVRRPSDDAYDDFIVVDEIVGQQGLPSLGIEFLRQRQISTILKLVRKRCPVDIQLHIGSCGDPTDFNKGWEVITIIERARPTSYDTDDLGAMDADGDAATHETIPFTGNDMYEVSQLVPGEVAAAQITDEIVAVRVCDKRTCGACGLPSDGCQVVLMVAKAPTGSPGLPIEVIYSIDGGETWGSTSVSTASLTEQATAAECVGTRFVIISEAGEALHYAATADIVDGSGATWAKVTTGIVATKGPKAIFSLGSTRTWIAAEGGYIYFSDDITAGLEVQTAGSVTTQDLNAIHGSSSRDIVAVGNSNAVLFTRNAGRTWASVTGPAAGIALNAVWARSEREWIVGGANGKVYYTRNSGSTWFESAFPGSGSGAVRDIRFATRAVGYLAHDTSATGTARGRILRTLDGGASWYVLPEDEGISMPVNDKINSLGVCSDDPNVVFGGGLADNGTDGFAVKAA